MAQRVVDILYAIASDPEGGVWRKWATSLLASSARNEVVTVANPTPTAHDLLQRLSESDDPLVAEWARAFLAGNSCTTTESFEDQERAREEAGRERLRREREQKESEQQDRDEQYAREREEEQAQEEENLKRAAAQLKQSVRKLTNRRKK